jgi:hypothetical protein
MAQYYQVYPPPRHTQHDTHEGGGKINSACAP